MRWLFCASIVAALSGCQAYHPDLDGRLTERAYKPVDVRPGSAEISPAPVMLPNTGELAPKRGTLGAPVVEPQFILLAAQKEVAQPEKDKKYKSMVERLQFPKDILGYEVPDIKVLPLTAPQADRDAQIKKQFPPLPALPNLPLAQPGLDGRPMTLADLQRQALLGNPMIRQAYLDIEAARGFAVQVGLYPNPTIGYEGDTIGQAGFTGGRTAGQQGGFIEQVIKTGGKLRLAQMAALVDVKIAEQKLRQSENDVQTQVRANYFALLSARKNFQVARSLTQLSDEVFNVLLLQFQAGEVAAYEPMQIRVLAMQSRGLLVQSYNRYVAAWKQLAASLGAPTMPLTDVAGQIDMPVPHYDYDQVLEYVLRNHSDVVAAALSIDRDRTLVRLAEVQPIPDVALHYTMTKDTTTPPFFMTQNVFVSVPVPFFNRNQGGIRQAQALLQRSMQENLRVRNDLSSKVAEVFARYENNRILLKMYKEQMLPNQVQAFRAAVARHAAEGAKNVSYNDVVTVQQSMANLLNSYLGVLNDQWIAVIDIGSLLQTKDLFQAERHDEVAPIPDMREMMPPRLRPRR